MNKSTKEALKEGLYGSFLGIFYIIILFVILFTLERFIPKEEPKTLVEKYGEICSDEFVFNAGTYEYCQEAIDSELREQEYEENMGSQWR